MMTMRKLDPLMGLSALPLAVLLVLVAAPAPAAAQLKLGFVNVAKVLDQAPQAQDLKSRLEREFGPKDRELLAQQKDIRGLEDQLIRDGDVMTQTQRADLEQDIRARKRELRRSQDEFREDLNIRRNELLREFQGEVFTVIQALGQDESYDLIVSDGVIFAGTRVDITDSVITRLKAEFKKKQ